MRETHDDKSASKRRKELRVKINALSYCINLFTVEAMVRARNTGQSYADVQINPGVEILKTEREKLRIEIGDVSYMESLL